MAQDASLASLNGSALVGLLKQLSLFDASVAAPSFADGMSRWLGWTEAGALFAALHGGLEPAPAGAKVLDAAKAAQAVSRLQAVFEQSIRDEPLLRGGQKPAGLRALPASAAVLRLDDSDVAPYRQRYAAIQQNMDMALDGLRSQLRASLAHRGGVAARLAALDAVMAQVAGAHERQLLSMMPLLVERHFDRLRSAAARRDVADEAAVEEARWGVVFRQDMQRLLHAELALRLMPLQGLLEALQHPEQHTDERRKEEQPSGV